MYRIYHNVRCRKSREGLEYLRKKNVEFEVVEYLKTGLDVERLKTLLQKLNLPASALVRTQEEEYRLSLKGKTFHEEEWLSILLGNPKLIRRPIVEAPIKAVIADPPEEMDCLFKS